MKLDMKLNMDLENCFKRVLQTQGRDWDRFLSSYTDQNLALEHKTSDNAKELATPPSDISNV